jgi:hypothetical protein
MSFYAAQLDSARERWQKFRNELMLVKTRCARQARSAPFSQL